MNFTCPHIYMHKYHVSRFTKLYDMYGIYIKWNDSWMFNTWLILCKSYIVKKNVKNSALILSKNIINCKYHFDSFELS